MQAIREYSALGEGRKDRSVGERLYQKLKDSDEYLCRGVVPSVEYAKLSGSKEELAARWVHPFSVPTLLFKHKSEPILILVNPGIRLDESFIQEMRHNQRYHSDQIRFDVDGITG